MKLICINNKPLEGNTVAPKLVVGQEYEVKEVLTDTGGNTHYDVGLKSNLSYVRSYETKEELERGHLIHWCHPSRFSSIK